MTNQDGLGTDSFPEDTCLQNFILRAFENGILLMIFS
jgi:histidinol phosphatase-like enzyme